MRNQFTPQLWWWCQDAPLPPCPAIPTCFRVARIPPTGPVLGRYCYGAAPVLARCCERDVTKVLRWYFDGSSKDLGPFCHPDRPSGATKQRPPTRPRPGFDSIGLTVIQRAPSPGGRGARGVT